ncbi:hypothetical protein BBP40_012401 [Aspergillus hancockii]|nr:hypothetical protein BBP40_012401 [Aspergillus hancockii]
MTDRKMDSDLDLNYSKTSPSPEATAMPVLTTVPTSITLSTEQFEKLYLTPLRHHQPALTKTFGNPTPLGPIIFLGGTLLVITSILEFILGNTFPCVVFGTIGGFWFAFGATLTPAFNAAAPYSTSTTNTVEGLSSPEFLNTYAFLFISMAILVTIYMICATRTNAVYVLIFAALILVFVFLAAGYWRLADADAVVGNRLIVGAGAALFVASLLGFYLLIVQLFEALGFPFHLPVGDLSGYWESQKESVAGRDVELGAGVGEKS